MKYTIYNKTTSEINRVIDCDENMIDVQLQLDEDYIEGNSDDIKQKVENGKIVDKTQTELDDYNFELIKDTIPDIDVTLSDEDLDIMLDEYFIGRVDIEQWKFDNYNILRKRYYPRHDNFIDAYVKINSNIPELKIQGEEQMNNHIEKSLNIKNKFPKKTHAI